MSLVVMMSHMLDTEDLKQKKNRKVFKMNGFTQSFVILEPSDSGQVRNFSLLARYKQVNVQ